MPWTGMNGLGFPHLSHKETEMQGFTVFFFFKSPVLSVSSCIQLHTCGVEGTLVVQRWTGWSHCLPRAHVLTEKAGFEVIIVGHWALCKTVLSLPRPPGFYATQCFCCLSAFFWSTYSWQGCGAEPEWSFRRGGGFSSWAAGDAILGVFMNFCGIQ